MDEKFLYQIMDELYQMKAPIIFKGALITNLILQERNNPSKMYRETIDIDGDWIGKPPSMAEIAFYIQEAVKQVDPALVVEISREYGERKSAGFTILRPNGEKVTSLDISIRENPYWRVYELENMKFQGVIVDKILVDKIACISSERLIRRVKDLADVYSLSFCTTYQRETFLKVAEESGRKVGDFSYFKNHKPELRYAYEKLKRINGKVSFDTVYSRVDEFTKPLQPLEKNLEMTKNPIQEFLEKEAVKHSCCDMNEIER